MQNLTKAHDELFRRTPDECYPSLEALYEHCYGRLQRSRDHWQAPESIRPLPAPNPGDAARLRLQIANDDALQMNDWSFTQLCALARVSKETVNKLSADTASRVFQETMPTGGKPLQIYTDGQRVRSIHKASYTRLHHVDLLNVVREFATDFQPPHKAGTDDPETGTGLYCGEQDMFCFLIDPMGWAEIDGEAFAPGFFLWNSEVGKRSVGVQSFWFQAVCSNHIVWDAVQVVQFTRKHTTNVHESLAQIRQIIAGLVEKRDQRRDGFVRVIRKAMQTTLGDDADELVKLLSRHGVARWLANAALDIAQMEGKLTVFSVVAAITSLTSELRNAGEKTQADQRASSLLQLAV